MASYRDSYGFTITPPLASYTLMSSSLRTLNMATLTKVAWELHFQCHLIANNGPEGFRALFPELESLQEKLRALSDGIVSNGPFYERMKEDRKVALQGCLSTCFETLRNLEDLINRSRELGIWDIKELGQDVNWATLRPQIEGLRSKIVVHTCDLSLFLIPSEKSHALEENERTVLALDTRLGHDPDAAIGPLHLRADNGHLGEPNTFRFMRTEITGQLETHQGHDQLRQASTSSNSLASASDGSLRGRTAPTSPLSLDTALSLSESTKGKVSHGQNRIEQPLYDRSINSRAVDQDFIEDNSSSQGWHGIERSRDMPYADSGRSNVAEAVTSAMDQLRQVRLQEQLARPIRYAPQNQTHKPDPDIVKIFEASVNKELPMRNLDTTDWLHVATWWLLKARATLANCNRHNYVSARGSMSPSTVSKSTSHQAYIDLLKASYILYDVVLKDESSPVILTDENHKSIADLSEAINEELSQYTTIDIPEFSIIQSQSLDIWEPVQPEEASQNGTDIPLSLGASRWIAVDIEDAGGDEERVLYRAFVNAGIGGKKFRIRTKGAPYMLLLATREGESEPKIILCNQSGSLCLERQFVPDDLPPLLHLHNATQTGFPGSRVSESIPFKFDNINVSISFQFEADLGHLIDIPKAYFDAIWQREPIDSKEFTESIIFKSSVELFEQLKTPNMDPTNPPISIKSCEVRILERSFGEAWHSMRRMVISPSIAERTPQCIEFFMPLSKVQIRRECGSRQVILKWSDTCQESSDKTDGNYNTLHSYVYDGNTPNIGVDLHFCTEKGAEGFEKAVLELNFPSDFAWSQLSSSGRIYDVVDTGREHKQYKAVVLFQSRSSWRYSNVYYLYRDADFAYDHSSCTVRFSRISFTDYISTHVDQLYRAETPVGFSHCEKKLGSAIIEFNDDSASRSFLSTLSPLYDLAFARRIQSLSTKSKPLFGGSKKSGKGAADLQLWHRGNRSHLAVRWGESVPDKWLTMAIPSEYDDSTRESSRVSFPKLPYARGTSLDMVNILARNPRSSNVEKREGVISIVFSSPKDREDFLTVLQSKPPSTTG